MGIFYLMQSVSYSEPTILIRRFCFFEFVVKNLVSDDNKDSIDKS